MKLLNLSCSSQLTNIKNITTKELFKRLSRIKDKNQINVIAIAKVAVKVVKIAMA